MNKKILARRLIVLAGAIVLAVAIAVVASAKSRAYLQAALFFVSHSFISI